jgi:hypothetical protein
VLIIHAAMLLGPVPAGGASTLPGIVICGLGVLGLLALPSEMSKMKSHRYGTGIVAIVLALDLGFVIAGIAMFSR